MESTGEIEERLDSILLEFFSTMDDLYKTQSYLNEEMKNGFLQMSRARYNMGAKAIGCSQYDENKMVASVKINVEDDNKGSNNVLVINNVSSVKTPVKDIPVETVGLRKRNVQKSEENEGKDEQEPVTPKESIVSVDKKQIPNPLNWFGVLVPQSLRQSQTSFKQAVEHSVKIANLKIKIEELRKDYIDCMGQKVKEKLKLGTDK